MYVSQEQRANLAFYLEYGKQFDRDVTLAVIAKNESSWGIDLDYPEDSHSEFGITAGAARDYWSDCGLLFSLDSIRFRLDTDRYFAAYTAIGIFDGHYYYWSAIVGPGPYAWGLAIRSYHKGRNGYQRPSAWAYLDRANRWARFLKMEFGL